MKKTTFIFVFILICKLLSAQVLKGRITDEGQLPLMGAEIVHLRSGNHVHSLDDGSFEIFKVIEGDTLQVSHLGYQTVTLIVPVGFQSLEIALTESPISIQEVVISPTINALNLITDIDIKTDPVNSSQEILRQVPGLFIGQHAGGGKAEQLFLRGFDVDHGTDVNVSVDGLPVNMVSHAHGQGYADLHFVIPETVEKIDFGKGPYYANKGDFTTAGYVNLETKQQIDNSMIKLEAGQFNSHRLMGMYRLKNSASEHAYLATEYLSTDGPFDSPQNFDRINLLGKYNGQSASGDQFGLTVSHFTSSWDASVQIPQRAVDNGLISRFGAIDDKEGGATVLVFDPSF